MNAEFDERVLDYVMGTLAPEALTLFEQELRRSAALRGMVREATELLADTTFALPAVAPTPGLKGRILAATVPSMWEQVIDRVARMWDLAAEDVRRVYARAMDPAEWNDAGIPGVTLFHLVGGPATAGADVGIIRFETSLAFPSHTHGESESYVVLDGEIHDSTGVVERPGDVVTHLERHSFRVSDAGPAYIALVLRGQLVF